jgi:3-methyl-2-oxobutanoate hydroxymethyltransferase
MDNKQVISNPEIKKTTIHSIRTKKMSGMPITMLTAYDYPTACALEQVGIDMILVGDSLAMVVLGYENTLPLTMDVILSHCRAVARGAKNPLLIGDMPFMSYQVSKEEAVRNAGRFLQEGGMDAVKLEGGKERLETIRAIVDAGIPVMGHLGLTPQSVHALGGFRPQARNVKSATRLIDDSKILEDAGCFSLVLESVPARLANHISGSLSIPTIGIGAGAGCDGQVLVSHDLLGIYPKKPPRFVKTYANLYNQMESAFATFIFEVRGKIYPSDEYSFEMPEQEWIDFLETLKGKQ